MRISDRSSDVCSSDLAGRFKIDLSRGREGEGRGTADAERSDSWLSLLTLPLRTSSTSSAPSEEPGTAERRCACALPMPTRTRALRFGRATGAFSSPASRPEEHTSELQPLPRNSYAVFYL